ncbi:ATP-dependent helicase [Hyphomonas sp. NPDC076900]|uniref:ATP-dependent helicase n=1 Tax=unclassified Hyphomonas TaxID=2630699 RepID=UPI003D047BF3
MLDLTTLNENQLAAVEWGEGPLLVLAGPGSGKTRVLTYRIARLIETTPGKHFKILGLTFTNAAAAEMRQRIATLVPNADERTLLTTFHSFAADLLRQHGHHVGLRPDFTLLVQDADRHSLLDEAIDAVDAGGEVTSSERLLPLITRLIENDIAPAFALQVLQRSSISNSEFLAQVYVNYRKLMIERNSLDFPALIAEALSLLEGQIGVRKQIQRIYPYICIDEFQDTNLTQYKILQHLVKEDTKNLFVVADDDQIIYQWNGASPDRLRGLKADFNMELIQLPENYRCPAEVVELANNLIQNNFGRFEGKGRLTAHKTAPGTSVVTLKHFANFDEEAAWVASDIQARPKHAREKCVVLARTKKLLEQVVTAMAEYGLHGYLAARKNEFECASLQWLHSMLRLANARGSRDFLRRVCKSFFSLEGIDLNVKDVIARSAAEEGDYLRSWIRSALDREELSPGARELLESAGIRLVERLDFWGFEKSAFAWLDALPDTAPDHNGIFDEYEEEKETWRALVAEISAQYGRAEVTLHLLLQELDLRSKAPAAPKGGIPCFTIHASKGLEFDHVYLVGMVEDQLPSWAALKKGDDSHEMREERRNCFVAITRAQETLSLSYSDRVLGWGKAPSRFLREMRLIE